MSTLHTFHKVVNNVDLRILAYLRCVVMRMPTCTYTYLQAIQVTTDHIGLTCYLSAIVANLP